MHCNYYTDSSEKIDSFFIWDSWRFWLIKSIRYIYSGCWSTLLLVPKVKVKVKKVKVNSSYWFHYFPPYYHSKTLFICAYISFGQLQHISYLTIPWLWLIQVRFEQSNSKNHQSLKVKNEFHCWSTVTW